MSLKEGLRDSSGTDHRQGRLQVSEDPWTANPAQTNRTTSECAPRHMKDQNWPQAHPGVRIFPWNEVTALHYTKLVLDQQRSDYQAMTEREADDWERQENHQVRLEPWALPMPSGGFLGTSLPTQSRGRARTFPRAISKWPSTSTTNPPHKSMFCLNLSIQFIKQLQPLLSRQWKEHKFYLWDENVYRKTSKKCLPSSHQ